MGSVGWLLPGSVNFTTRDTLESGRAVFTNANLKSGQAILTTTDNLSPLSHVILRPYRKEVCSQCFFYDRGREWRIKDASAGTAFCSDDCRQKWQAENDALVHEALTVVETASKSISKRKSNADHDSEAPEPSHKQGSHALQHVHDVWEEISKIGATVKESRQSIKPTKSQRAALHKVKDLLPDPDILAYTLSGIVTTYKSHKLTSMSNITSAQLLLPSLFALASDPTVFLRTPTTLSPLSDYTSSYLLLLAILPESMLDLTSSELIINLASRASHNAFSIRPEGTSDGEQSGEFLGWGVWPEASFFNHSCRPNVRKERNGRVWSFCVDTDQNSGVVSEDEQLCITYLGGDERDLDVFERRQRLSEQWGFRCCCDRCVQESGENVL